MSGFNFGTSILSSTNTGGGFSFGAFGRYEALELQLDLCHVLTNRTFIKKPLTYVNITVTRWLINYALICRLHTFIMNNNKKRMLVRSKLMLYLNARMMKVLSALIHIHELT